MQTFGEQLSAARKKHGMTQEQIAQEIHVSRQSVSRWETGKTLPDVEIIKHLSSILECNFFASEPSDEKIQNSVPADECVLSAQDDSAELIDSEADHDADKKTGNSFTRWKAWPVAAPIVLILLCCVFIIGRGTPESAANHEILPLDALATPIPVSFFQQEQLPEEGKAFLNFVQPKEPLKAIRSESFSSGAGWHFSFKFLETNGIPFTIENIMTCVFLDNGEQDGWYYTGDEILRIMGAGQLYPHIRREFNGGFPLQGVSGIGISISGVDNNGNGLEFHSYIELSKEIAEEE